MPIFLSWFRRKHLFITTFIEKHCTGSLNINFLTFGADIGYHKNIKLRCFFTTNIFLFQSIFNEEFTKNSTLTAE